MEYQIITQLPSDIHLKSVKLLINLAQYKKQYSPSQDAITTASSRPQTSQNFSLCTAHTHFSSILIDCHVPLTDFSACSLVLEFSNSLYIHHNYLLFHILTFINLTCFSTTKITRYTDSTLLNFVVNNLIA